MKTKITATMTRPIQPISSITTIDETAIRKLIRDRCKAIGSQSAFAANAGVSAAYLSDMLLGKRGVSDAIAGAIGYEKFTAFRKIGA
jgi:hypothetical protein